MSDRGAVITVARFRITRTDEEMIMSALFSTPKSPALPPPPDQSNQRAQEAAKKARQIAALSGKGMGGTIATSAMGLETQAPVAARTLLGG